MAVRWSGAVVLCGRCGGGLSKTRLLQAMLGVAVLLILARPVLPDFLVRLPESWIPPTAVVLDMVFAFVQNDLGLIYVTRWFAEGPLQCPLDMMANLLEGKRRWPNIGPIPWPAITAVAIVIGYYLGGWRLALLAGVTFVWTALMGQWKMAMQTMSVSLFGWMSPSNCQFGSTFPMVSGIRSPFVRTIAWQFAMHWTSGSLFGWHLMFQSKFGLTSEMQSPRWIRRWIQMRIEILFESWFRKCFR